MPDELTTIIVNRKAPPLPAIPQEFHRKRVTIITCCYAGSIDDGERVVAPLRKFGTPLLDLCAPKPYVAHQSMFDASYPARLVVLLRNPATSNALATSNRRRDRLQRANSVPNEQHADFSASRGPGGRALMRRDRLQWSKERPHAEPQRHYQGCRGFRGREGVGARAL